MEATKVEDEFSRPAEPSDALDVMPPRGGPARPRSPALVSISIVALVAVLALVTAVIVLKSPLRDAGPLRNAASVPEMFAIVCVLWAAALLAPVSLHYRGNSHDLNLDDVALILGLVFLAPSVLVLSCVCVEAFVQAVVRRKAPIRVAFNVVAGALAIAVAAFVFRELLGRHSPVSGPGWAAASAGLCAASAVVGLAVWVVTTLNGQTAEHRTAFMFTTQAMLTFAGIGLALVVLDAAWFDLWSILPLLLVAGLIIVAYRGYTRLSLRFASLNRLYDFSRFLGTASLEPTSMSLDVLRQVCTVMRARRAQLVLAEPSGIPRCVTLDERGPSGIEPINLDEASIISRAIETGTASLHQHGVRLCDPVVGMYRDAVVAPLMNENVAIGAIIAIDRDEEMDSFDDDDLRLFEALVANASANLERARLVEELRFEVDSKSHQATHDMLTGLPNRTLFLTRAASALSDSKGVAIVLIDIDRFKDVNDTLGHAIGDLLLCEIADRLSRAVSGDITVARLGGDEFALLIPGVTDHETAVAMVHELHAEMSRPIKMDGLALAVTASAGIALAPEHGDDVELLQQRADIAMYLAKGHRSTVEVYSFDQDQSMRRRLMLGGLLTHALEQGDELRVMYQPIADVESRQIVQVEALARWYHPEHGAIPPEEFIGIAEQLGVISQITDIVLAQGCAQLARWRDAGITIELAVNVSGREFADIGLVERVARHLRAHDLPPEVLTLEVTETELMDDLTQASQVLNALDRLGIRIGIDDYGTGYSSLAYLHRLPVKKLKIDRSFVTNLPTDLSNGIIVRSSIAMAHSLGMKVVAEGAEDEVTCAMLADAECDYIQGYYLSKPMEPDELQDWVLGGASLKFDALDSATPVMTTPELPRVVSRPRSTRLAGADRHH